MLLTDTLYLYVITLRDGKQNLLVVTDVICASFII